MSSKKLGWHRREKDMTRDYQEAIYQQARFIGLDEQVAEQTAETLQEAIDGVELDYYLDTEYENVSGYIVLKLMSLGCPRQLVDGLIGAIQLAYRYGIWRGSSMVERKLAD